MLLGWSQRRPPFGREASPRLQESAQCSRHERKREIRVEPRKQGTARPAKLVSQIATCGGASRRPPSLSSAPLTRASAFSWMQGRRHQHLPRRSGNPQISEAGVGLLRRSDVQCAERRARRRSRSVSGRVAASEHVRRHRTGSRIRGRIGDRTGASALPSGSGVSGCGDEPAIDRFDASWDPQAFGLFGIRLG